MLQVDIPTAMEFESLVRTRADACVSIYLKTTPISQHTTGSRTELGNYIAEAGKQLLDAGTDKRVVTMLTESLEDLAEDDDFWRLQANSLAILATSDKLKTFRLANGVTPMVQVSDRFHLKPLLRAITVPQSAMVLALSENGVRLVQVHPDLPPSPVAIRELPRDAASAVGTANINSRSASGRIQGAEGQNVRLRQYARRVDEALRAVLSGRSTPLILAATGRLASLFPSVCSYPHLAEQYIEDSGSRLSDAELAEGARPILDKLYAEELDRCHATYDKLTGEGRATTELSDVARAATFGGISTLLVDVDAVIPGRIDEDTGLITYADAESAESYGVVDEIVGRAILTGARVLGVRQADLPNNAELAAILRFAV